jgi:hypothetical protein
MRDKQFAVEDAVALDTPSGGGYGRADALPGAAE